MTLIFATKKHVMIIMKATFIRLISKECILFITNLDLILCKIGQLFGKSTLDLNKKRMEAI